MWPQLLCLCLLLGLAEAGNPCIPHTYKTGFTVCVCNSTYCDDVDPVGQLSPGQGALYVSSQSGKRLTRTLLTAGTKPSFTTIVVDSSVKYQTIIGFGGAFTDASGINLRDLPENMQDMIINGYYGPDGLEYSIGRVPIGSTDFSTHEYSYNDVANDFDLVNFNLTMEDYTYKIPYIKKAQKANKNMKLFSSPWAPPAWMKTNNDERGGGLLDGQVNGQYYKTWANYFIKFFEHYHAEGIDFWGTTTQNEPTTGRVKNYKWQTLFFNATMQRDFIKGLLGPAFKASPVTKDLKVMILDDQRFNLPHWANVVLKDKEAAQYVDGIAVHWYEDAETPATLLTETHNNWPDYFILPTEACTGYLVGEQYPIPGSWTRGQEYASDILDDLNNWATGWMDWNLCLNPRGGPNWVENFVDSPIIVEKEKKEFFKQPMWHVMGHFSKFMKPGSQRVKTTATNAGSSLKYVAFVTPQGNRGVVVLNTGMAIINLSINDVNKNQYFSFVLEAKSIATLVYA